ncbi:MAG: putative NADPH-quinone reductase [Arenicella sp.]|jgi:putative NADPH-quinone reductase
MSNILIIQGHPDPDASHFGHVLAEKYISAAQSANHDLRQLTVAKLSFPLLQKKQDFDHGVPCADIQRAQEDIVWADHVVVIYPLWMGTMPAILKGFFEQTLRPGFAFNDSQPRTKNNKLLGNKSARIFVTMGMPGYVYRWFFKSHSLKNLKRNILSFCGFKPVKHTIIGGVFEGNEDQLHVDLGHAAHLGRLGK